MDILFYYPRFKLHNLFNFQFKIQEAENFIWFGWERLPPNICSSVMSLGSLGIWQCFNITKADFFRCEVQLLPFKTYKTITKSEMISRDQQPKHSSGQRARFIVLLGILPVTHRHTHTLQLTSPKNTKTLSRLEREKLQHVHAPPSWTLTAW